jgi:hypothetical protein
LAEVPQCLGFSLRAVRQLIIVSRLSVFFHYRVQAVAPKVSHEQTPA